MGCARPWEGRGRGRGRGHRENRATCEQVAFNCQATRVSTQPLPAVPEQLRGQGRFPASGAGRPVASMKTAAPRALAPPHPATPGSFRATPPSAQQRATETSLAGPRPPRAPPPDTRFPRDRDRGGVSGRCLGRPGPAALHHGPDVAGGWESRGKWFGQRHISPLRRPLGADPPRSCGSSRGRPVGPGDLGPATSPSSQKNPPRGPGSAGAGAFGAAG